MSRSRDDGGNRTLTQVYGGIIFTLMAISAAYFEWYWLSAILYLVGFLLFAFGMWNLVMWPFRGGKK